MKKRILFVTPPYHAGVVEVAGRWIPLQMVYLAGAAREAGYDAFIYDAMTKGVGMKEVEDRIRDLSPDYVATSAITCTLPDALLVLEAAKRFNPDIRTLLGGIHPTFMHQEVYSLSGHVDYVIRGEGEHTLKELLIELEKGSDGSGVRGVASRGFITPGRPLMPAEELDRLSKAWDLLDWNDYSYFIIPGSRLGAIDTSRGCNKDCSFCSQRKFWEQKWRARNPEALVKEIQTLKRRYGVNVVLLTDDYPTYDRERWEKFLDLLIERDLGVYILMETRVEDILRDKDILPRYKKAGIIHIYVGIEATDEGTLSFFKKDIKSESAMEALRLLKENNIITETSMILGLPHDTRESIERTLKSAIEYNPDFCHFLAIAPWPYADIYGEIKEYIKVFDYRRYNLIDPVIKPESMTLEDIDKAIVDCYRRFYMGKLKEIVKTADEFKKEYLLVAMDLMMRSSFLVNKIGGLGVMPKEVERMLALLKDSARDVKKASCKGLALPIVPMPSGEVLKISDEVI